MQTSTKAERISWTCKHCTFEHSLEEQGEQKCAECGAARPVDWSCSACGLKMQQKLAPPGERCTSCENETCTLSFQWPDGAFCSRRPWSSGRHRQDDDVLAKLRVIDQCGGCRKCALKILETIQEEVPVGFMGSVEREKFEDRVISAQQAAVSTFSKADMSARAFVTASLLQGDSFCCYDCATRGEGEMRNEFYLCCWHHSLHCVAEDFLAYCVAHCAGADDDTIKLKESFRPKINGVSMSEIGEIVRATRGVLLRDYSCRLSRSILQFCDGEDSLGRFFREQHRRLRNRKKVDAIEALLSKAAVPLGDWEVAALPASPIWFFCARCLRAAKKRTKAEPTLNELLGAASAVFAIYEECYRVLNRLLGYPPSEALWMKEVERDHYFGESSTAETRAREEQLTRITSELEDYWWSEKRKIDLGTVARLETKVRESLAICCWTCPSGNPRATEQQIQSAVTKAIRAERRNQIRAAVDKSWTDGYKNVILLERITEKMEVPVENLARACASQMDDTGSSYHREMARLRRKMGGEVPRAKRRKISTMQ